MRNPDDQKTTVDHTLEGLTEILIFVGLIVFLVFVILS